jgi:hypothetical protein
MAGEKEERKKYFRADTMSSKASILKRQDLDKKQNKEKEKKQTGFRADTMSSKASILKRQYPREKNKK